MVITQLLKVEMKGKGVLKPSQRGWKRLVAALWHYKRERAVKDSAAIQQILTDTAAGESRVVT